MHSNASNRLKIILKRAFEMSNEVRKISGGHNDRRPLESY
jgi:hypothetical protein